jgi:hypothetical protein
VYLRSSRPLLFSLPTHPRTRARRRIAVLARAARVGCPAHAGAPGLEGAGAALLVASGGFGASGYSYVTSTARDAFGITGGNAGIDGYVSINFVAAPESSTWAMTLAGFAGVGWLAYLRRRKRTQREGCVDSRRS